MNTNKKSDTLVATVQKHPTTIKGYEGSIQECAQEVGSWDYLTFGEFLKHFSQAFHQRSVEDSYAEKFSLAKNLLEISVSLSRSQNYLEEARNSHILTSTTTDENVRSLDSIKDLAFAVENMRYDKTAEFMKELHTVTAFRYSKNASSRSVASESLKYCARGIDKASTHMDVAWNTCKKYM